MIIIHIIQILVLLYCFYIFININWYTKHQFKRLYIHTKKKNVKWTKVYRKFNVYSSEIYCTFRGVKYRFTKIENGGLYLQDENEKHYYCLSNKLVKKFCNYFESNKIDYELNDQYLNDFPIEFKKILRKEKVKKLLV